MGRGGGRLGLALSWLSVALRQKRGRRGGESARTRTVHSPQCTVHSAQCRVCAADAVALQSGRAAARWAQRALGFFSDSRPPFCGPTLQLLLMLLLLLLLLGLGRRPSEQSCASADEQQLNHNTHHSHILPACHFSFLRSLSFPFLFFFSRFSPSWACPSAQVRAARARPEGAKGAWPRDAASVCVPNQTERACVSCRCPPVGLASVRGLQLFLLGRRLVVGPCGVRGAAAKLWPRSPRARQRRHHSRGPIDLCARPGNGRPEGRERESAHSGPQAALSAGQQRG